MLPNESASTWRSTPFIGDNVLKNIHIALDGGLATCPIHGKTRQELISSAHQGLLIARNRGGK